jgi:hypothetical protein
MGEDACQSGCTEPHTPRDVPLSCVIQSRAVPLFLEAIMTLLWRLSVVQQHLQALFCWRCSGRLRVTVLCWEHSGARAPLTGAKSSAGTVARQSFVMAQ